jgi:hypothetical protein
MARSENEGERKKEGRVGDQGQSDSVTVIEGRSGPLTTMTYLVVTIRLAATVKRHKVRPVAEK